MRPDRVSNPEPLTIESCCTTDCATQPGMISKLLLEGTCNDRPLYLYQVNFFDLVKHLLLCYGKPVTSKGRI